MFRLAMNAKLHQKNTVTWEGNQPRSRTVKRSSTDLTELSSVQLNQLTEMI